MARGVATNLLGRRVRRDDSRPHCWPSALKPNLSNEHIATIHAVWVDRDGDVKALLVDPEGTMAEAWLSHVKLEAPWP